MIENFLYAGAELDSASSNLLKKYHIDGWRFYGHHMTIYFGAITLPQYIEDWLLLNEGKEFTLTVIALGILDKACAVQIEFDDIPCTNNLRHVTVSINPDKGKPVDSNYITDWINITPFTLKATIKIYKKQ